MTLLDQLCSDLIIYVSKYLLLPERCNLNCVSKGFKNISFFRGRIHRLNIARSCLTYPDYIEEKYDEDYVLYTECDSSLETMRNTYCKSPIIANKLKIVFELDRNNYYVFLFDTKVNDKDIFEHLRKERINYKYHHHHNERYPSFLLYVP